MPCHPLLSLPYTRRMKPPFLCRSSAKSQGSPLVGRISSPHKRLDADTEQSCDWCSSPVTCTNVSWQSAGLPRLSLGPVAIILYSTATQRREEAGQPPGTAGLWWATKPLGGMPALLWWSWQQHLWHLWALSVSMDCATPMRERER